LAKEKLRKLKTDEEIEEEKFRKLKDKDKRRIEKLKAMKSDFDTEKISPRKAGHIIHYSDT
jgi:uncharacterized protein YjaG (DUF416 family)